MIFPAKIEAEMEWISVKDRLPPDDWDLQVMARMDGVEFPEHAHFICRYPDDYSHWKPDIQGD